MRRKGSSDMSMNKVSWKTDEEAMDLIQAEQAKFELEQENKKLAVLLESKSDELRSSYSKFESLEIEFGELRERCATPQVDKAVDCRLDEENNLNKAAVKLKSKRRLSQVLKALRTRRLEKQALNADLQRQKKLVAMQSETIELFRSLQADYKREIAKLQQSLFKGRADWEREREASAMRENRASWELELEARAVVFEQQLAEKRLELSQTKAYMGRRLADVSAVYSLTKLDLRRLQSELETKNAITLSKSSTAGSAKAKRARQPAARLTAKRSRNCFDYGGKFTSKTTVVDDSINDFTATADYVALKQEDLSDFYGGQLGDFESVSHTGQLSEDLLARMEEHFGTAPLLNNGYGKEQSRGETEAKEATLEIPM